MKSIYTKNINLKVSQTLLSLELENYQKLNIQKHVISMSVCVIGDAFVDILTPINNLIKGGVTINDRIKICTGGTANVAIWLSRLGIKTAFVGQVGSDIFGKYFKEILKKENVEDLTIVDISSETGVCISLIEENERSFIVKRGANDTWNTDMLNIIDRICQYKVIYTTAYSLVNRRNKKMLEAILSSAKGKDCEIWFNLASHNIVKQYKEEITNFINNFADNLVMNADEAKILTGNSVNPMGILNKHVKNIIITMGKNGCLIYSQNVDNAIHIPACKIKDVIDVTGAGDAFISGFLAGYIRGCSIEKCGQMGNELASKVIQKIGAV